jgi:hypothetical protein
MRSTVNSHTQSNDILQLVDVVAIQLPMQVYWQLKKSLRVLPNPLQPGGPAL